MLPANARVVPSSSHRVFRSSLSSFSSRSMCALSLLSTLCAVTCDGYCLIAEVCVVSDCLYQSDSEFEGTSVSSKCADSRVCYTFYGDKSFWSGLRSRFRPLPSAVARYLAAAGSQSSSANIPVPPISR